MNYISGRKKYYNRKILFLFPILYFWMISGIFAQNPSGINLGADISFLQRIEDYGGLYFLDGEEKECMQIFKEKNFNYVRLRIWHSPSDGYSGLDTTLSLAARIKERDLRFLLDIHYSDWWADPAHQTKPTAWEGLTFDELDDSVYQYTYDLIARLKNEGLLPDMVQIGNEITPGFLWPEGRVDGQFNTPEQWNQFTTLLKSGIKGAEDAAGDEPLKTVIHIDKGGDFQAADYFYSMLDEYEVQYDIIALSYYPFWHGGMDRMQCNVDNLGQKFGKDIILAETAYPWTLEWFDDKTNLVGEIDEGFAGYPATIDGQENFVFDLLAAIGGAGSSVDAVYWWEPEYITSGFTSSWENMTLFDETGNDLPGLSAFSSVQDYKKFYYRVELPLNISSIPDTSGYDEIIEMRGSVNNQNPWVLSDGRYINWEWGEDMRLSNSGGDSYKLIIYAPVGKTLTFKFWSERASELGINYGWDIGEDNGDPDGNSILTVESDTTLPTHFFNASGSLKEYDWRPWEEKPDSIALWLRVFMKTPAAINQGYTDNMEYVYFLGDEPGTGNKIKLYRESEDNTLPSYYVYSGAVYYPPGMAGVSDEYYFAIDESMTESLYLQNPRDFVIPVSDSTIHWVYYGDTPPGTILGMEENEEGSVSKNELMIVQNSRSGLLSITISPGVKTSARYRIFDILGRSMNVSGDLSLPVGRSNFNVNVSTLSSGVYILALSGEGINLCRKFLRVK